MSLLNEITGIYFIRGQYIAMRVGDGGPWQVSKVEHNPTNTKQATLTLIGVWWTESDAREGIRWHTQRDNEGKPPLTLGHPPTWPNYIS